MVDRRPKECADGHMQRAYGHIDGHIAATWEYSPDKLTLAIKTNPAAKFPPVAPMSSRYVDAADVLFSVA